MGRPDTHVPNPLVGENVFLTLPREQAPLPSFASARALLPSPLWPARESAVACYWKAWEIAFANLRQPPPGSPLIANFIHPAFNHCIFMWDSVFMMMFGRYGLRAFDFQRTLDNFYARQHTDGYICREITIETGEERFERFDPSSTGPNVMPWSEWEHYLQTHDTVRLARVFPVLLAYTQWFARHRTWQDGTYWSSGWGCGMDNQPRLPPGYDVCFDHGHLSWIDTTLQQILANKLLVRMAAVLNRDNDTAPLAEEAGRLTQLINTAMWSDRAAFYFDRFRDGTLSTTKTIGAYWALLAGTVPPDRLQPFLAHLRDTSEFARPHRVPTLSADDPAYDPTGGYWRGAIWAPTNYMVLRGLQSVGKDDLAHEIAMNHHAHVVRVFESTGTLWENYAPESAAPGNPAMKDFVGWTGVSAIAILFEQVFGITPDTARDRLTWDIRLTDEHGVERYPFANDATVNLLCAARRSITDEPLVTASSSRPVELMVKWPGGSKTIQL